MYQFQEFPKWIFSEIKKEMIVVKDAVEEAFHTAKAEVKAEAIPPTPVTHTETLTESVQASDGARTPLAPRAPKAPETGPGDLPAAKIELR